MRLPISIGLYRKSLIFWLATFLAFLAIIALVERQGPITASYSRRLARRPLDPSYQSAVYRTNIYLDAQGSAIIDGVDASSAFEIRRQEVTFRYKVLDEPGQDFLGTEVEVRLPETVTVDQVTPRAFLIHSYSPDVTIEKVGRSILRFSTGEVSGDAIYTLQLTFPKGAITFPFNKRLRSALANSPELLWIDISVIIPIIALGLLVNFLRHHFRPEKVPTLPIRSSPPDPSVKPAVAGVLLRGSIGPPAIVATLIDLARRGYLDIYAHSDGDFSFAKREKLRAVIEPVIRSPGQSTAGDLAPFEQFLLAKIFSEEGLAVHRQELLFRVGHRLFSSKIAQFYLLIYDETIRRGWFVENPAQLHRRWRDHGLRLFFIGLAGFLTGLFLEPKLLLLLWLGVIVSAGVIFRFAPRAPLHTATGIQELAKWRSFLAHLALAKNVTARESIQGQFDQFLPYAVTFGVADRWISRFERVQSALPTWFMADRPVSGVEELGTQLFPLVAWVARTLAESREPSVS